MKRIEFKLEENLHSLLRGTVRELGVTMDEYLRKCVTADLIKDNFEMFNIKCISNHDCVDCFEDVKDINVAVLDEVAKPETVESLTKKYGWRLKSLSSYMVVYVKNISYSVIVDKLPIQKEYEIRIADYSKVNSTPLSLDDKVHVAVYRDDNKYVGLLKTCYFKDALTIEDFDLEHIWRLVISNNL